MKTSIHASGVKRLLPLILLVIGLYVILPQLHVFRAGLQHLHNINYGLLTVAFACVGLTFVLGGLTYVVLAYKPLYAGRTITVQLAANFINRLLPAGLGGIGVNYRYLRKQKHTEAQAASVVAVNNSLGAIGNLALVIVLASIYHSNAVPVHVSSHTTMLILAGVCIILAIITAVPRLRRKVGNSMRSFGHQLAQYRTRPFSLTSGLLIQVCLTLTNVIAFWLCALAVHVSLSFVAALLVFSFGFGVGNAAPTPGGLGGVEAGLVAGLVAYHVTSPMALAAVLVYRLTSYWLPLLISAPIFLFASRKHYF